MGYLYENFYNELRAVLSVPCDLSMNRADLLYKVWIWRVRDITVLTLSYDSSETIKHCFL